ncbi:hypothetical protein HHI36_016784 [Cryptolaemus montrouzieri]|uniref:Uncharacterized protein n=1 Tax=Cryptolaemus montrouzieri TaxID=559131 RepID=A0ABD2NKN8_9CUCU
MKNNVDLLKQSHSREELLEIFESFGLRPILMEPSRLTYNSSTCLDNIIFSNLDSHTYYKSTDDPHLSDHLDQEIAVNMTATQNWNVITRPNINEENTAKFIETLKMANRDVLMNKRAELFNENFHHVFQLCFNNSFPTVGVRKGLGWNVDAVDNDGSSALKRAVDATQTIHKVQS